MVRGIPKVGLALWRIYCELALHITYINPYFDEKTTQSPSYIIVHMHLQL